MEGNVVVGGSGLYDRSVQKRAVFLGFRIKSQWQASKAC